jgi:hypothetical protein
MRAPTDHIPDKQTLGDALRRHLGEASRLRIARAAPADAVDHLALKAWQSARLARTYRDLLDNPRYHAAAGFFLEELYGTHDFTTRDTELARVIPTLVSALPARALATLVDAVRMDALSESLDAEMVAQLRLAGRASDIDEAAYAEAYRASGRRSDRELQIELVGRIGATLDRLTHMPLLGTTLRLMKKPAELAGLGRLHQFLQQGFDAFHGMRGAKEFLATVCERETALMTRIFSAGT